MGERELRHAIGEAIGAFDQLLEAHESGAMDEPIRYEAEQRINAVRQTYGMALTDAILAKATPSPHPLIALLAEVLAVTSLAQPPSSAAVSGVEVVLEWDGLEERTLSVQDGTYRFDDFAAHTHKSTTDPAEARAWLADALEAT